MQWNALLQRTISGSAVMDLDNSTRCTPKLSIFAQGGPSNIFPDKDIRDVVNSLVAQGILDTGKDSTTKQISRLKGKRFYVIALSKLL